MEFKHKSYEDMPTKKWILVHKVWTENKKPEDMKEVAFSILQWERALCILEDITMDIIGGWSREKFFAYQQHYHKLFFQLPRSRDIANFSLNGVKYHVDRNYAQMNVAKWFDLELIEAKGLDNVTKVFAMLCYPDGETKYDGRKRLERAELFNELPIAILWAIHEDFKKKNQTFAQGTLQFTNAMEGTMKSINDILLS